jgi:ferredoxin-NADP reductase
LNTVPHGAIRRALDALVAPDVFDFWASRIDPVLSWNRPLARIVGRRPASATAVTLDLAANRHFAGLLPGQHLNLSVEIDGVRHTRSYSPSLESADGRRLSITIGRVEGGTVSRHLREHARVGEVVELGPGFGTMVWPEPPQGRWLFLAAGSGITPLLSLIRSLPRRDDAPIDLDLLYWSRRREDVCFMQELRDRSAADARMRCRFVLTGEAAQCADEAEGRPSLEQLLSLAPDLEQRKVYACGPAGFVDTVRALLNDRCHSFQAEAFTPPAALESATGTVRVTLLRSRRTLELPIDRALLPALEAQGLQPAHGCRMGLCNTCACAKLSGTTQHLVSEIGRASCRERVS